MHSVFGCVGAVLLVALAGCASEAREVTYSEQEPRKTYTEESEGRSISHQAARAVNGSNFVEIQFKEGSAQLSAQDERSLQSLVEQASRAGQIDDVLVLSWADNEYPSSRLGKLSKEQVALASRRNDAIANCVTRIKEVDVEKYNLAQQPKALAKLLNTRDARLKKTLVEAGLPTTADSPQYPSKASRAVVIVKLR